MDGKKGLVVLALWLAPMGALAHTATMDTGRSLSSVTSAHAACGNASRHSFTGENNLWTCWYDGAPVHNMPLPAPKAVASIARAGQVFAADAVEATPLGTEWIRVKSGSNGDRLWVPLAYCRRVAPENAATGDLPIGRERVGPRDGLPLDYCPSDLVTVPGRYCFNDLPQQLRAEAREALLQMLDAARREAGLTIQVLSSYRSAQTQASLCRRKIASMGIEQREVARPGHSEHQLGTTADLVSHAGLHLLHERFDSTREGRWLRLNCRRFGFVQSYSRGRASRAGIAYEPWHFRYIGPANAEREKATMNDE